MIGEVEITEGDTCLLIFALTGCIAPSVNTLSVLKDACTLYGCCASRVFIWKQTNNTVPRLLRQCLSK